jgi:hypothetical protein
MILDRDNRHTDSMDWALDHACASSQNMPALFSAESNRFGNCSDPIWKPCTCTFGDVLVRISYCLWRGGEEGENALDRRNTLVVSEFESTAEPAGRLRVLVVYDCDLMIRLPLASLIDLTTAVTSSLKSTISKHNSIRERRTEVTALVVVWNILARASTVSWILHAGASPRGKDSKHLKEYS